MPAALPVSLSTSHATSPDARRNRRTPTQELASFNKGSSSAVIEMADPVPILPLSSQAYFPSLSFPCCSPCLVGGGEEATLRFTPSEVLYQTEN